MAPIRPTAEHPAAMLAVLAAVTFLLPLIARLVEALGAPRGTAVLISLAVASVGAVTVVAARRRRARVGATPNDEEDDHARV